MKFDVVIGNPPYQEVTGAANAKAIWPKFVEKSFEICKEGGYVSLIHPSGWRDVKGNFSHIKDLLKSQSIELLWKNYDTCNHKTLFHKESKSDLFKITISYNSKLLVSSCINGNIYQPKIKYGVDIRPIIPSIISSIRLNLIK